MSNKEPKRQMIIQDETELDEKLRALMQQDGTVYAAYRTGEALGMSKMKLYANLVLLLAHEKKIYFDMAVDAINSRMPAPFNSKERP